MLLLLPILMLLRLILLLLIFCFSIPYAAVAVVADTAYTDDEVTE